ncbi:MAG: SDR family NAD(P)-dependent oxidoreductase [Mycobacterium sp.]|nr:SDR family NAD(P)-dependent oxidoreductase [Mycobacterium sp.]
MKTTMEFGSRWVLVTGASSGLGKELASQLATHYQANLILVARRLGHLNVLKEQLEKENNVQCHVIAADLSVPADVDRVYEEATAIGDVYGLILNAGVTHFGKHLDLDWTSFLNMLATNVTSVARLTSLFTPYLIQKGQGGGVMVISSMASLFPVPYQAAYAGTKAFITNYSQSLHQELRSENVSITVFLPGGIDTEMTRNSDLKYFENTKFLQDVKSCAADALSAMQSRRSYYVPGRMNRAQLFISRFLPRSLVAFAIDHTYRKALNDA